MTANKQFDVIIIGGSYSGLAAAMALGRALKEVLIIPYAFAIENNNESWNYPLIINVDADIEKRTIHSTHPNSHPRITDNN